MIQGNTVILVPIALSHLLAGGGGGGFDFCAKAPPAKR